MNISHLRGQNPGANLLLLMLFLRILLLLGLLLLLNSKLSKRTVRGFHQDKNNLLVISLFLNSHLELLEAKFR